MHESLPPFEMPTDVEVAVAADAFRLALSAFVRSRVHPHFDDESEAKAALAKAGFSWSRLHSPVDYADRIEVDEHGAGLVRVIEAGAD